MYFFCIFHCLLLLLLLYIYCIFIYYYSFYSLFYCTFWRNKVDTTEHKEPAMGPWHIKRNTQRLARH